MSRKIISLIALSLSVAIIFSACGGKTQEAEITNPHETDASLKAVIIQSDEGYQYTRLRQAFIDRMRILGYDEAKMKIDIKNAGGDKQKLTEIASSLVGSDYDLIVPVCASAASAVASTGNTIPCVFICVPDPVGLGLMSLLEAPDKNMTGSVYRSDTEELIMLINILTPDVHTVAVMYSKDDPSLTADIESAKAALSDKGYGIEEIALENTDNIEAVTSDALTRAEAIYIPADEELEKVMEKIVAVTNANGKYVYAQTATAAEKGALACVCPETDALAKASAEAANKILQGNPVSSVSADVSSEPQIFISKDTSQLLGVEIPKLENSHLV